MDHVLITDDHPLVRKGLRAVIAAAFPSSAVDEASSLEEAVNILVHNPDIDLMMLDLDLPDAKHLEGLSLLRDRFPAIPIAIISATNNASLARAALAAGASGFISKSQNPETLVTALRSISEGGVYSEVEEQLPSCHEQQVLHKVQSLTPQQYAVFQMVVRGNPNKQIAHELNVSLTTVKAHVSAVLFKLGVTSRTQAAILASRVNLFPATEKNRG